MWILVVRNVCCGSRSRFGVFLGRGNAVARSSRGVEGGLDGLADDFHATEPGRLIERDWVGRDWMVMGRTFGRKKIGSVEAPDSEGRDGALSVGRGAVEGRLKPTAEGRPEGGGRSRQTRIMTLDNIGT